MLRALNERAQVSLLSGPLLFALFSLDYLYISMDAVVGVLFAGQSLKQLAPIGLGLLPGISGGSQLVKGLLPWHHFPPIMSTFADAIYAPFLLSLLIAVYQAIGDFVFLGLLLFLVAKQLLFLPFSIQLSNSFDTHSLRRALTNQARVGTGLTLFGVVYLAVYFSYHQFYFDALETLDLPSRFFALNGWSIGLTIARALSTAILSKLFTSGLMLSIMAHMHLMHSQMSFRKLMDVVVSQLERDQVEELIAKGQDSSMGGTGGNSSIDYGDAPVEGRKGGLAGRPVKGMDDFASPNIDEDAADSSSAGTSVPANRPHGFSMNPLHDLGPSMSTVGGRSSVGGTGPYAGRSAPIDARAPVSRSGALSSERLPGIASVEMDQRRELAAPGALAPVDVEVQGDFGGPISPSRKSNA
jgi:hypothetical protein